MESHPPSDSDRLTKLETTVEDVVNTLTEIEKDVKQLVRILDGAHGVITLLQWAGGVGLFFLTAWATVKGYFS